MARFAWLMFETHDNSDNDQLLRLTFDFDDRQERKISHLSWTRRREAECLGSNKEVLEL